MIVNIVISAWKHLCTAGLLPHCKFAKHFNDLEFYRTNVVSMMPVLWFYEKSMNTQALWMNIVLEKNSRNGLEKKNIRRGLLTIRKKTWRNLLILLMILLQWLKKNMKRKTIPGSLDLWSCSLLEQDRIVRVNTKSLNQNASKEEQKFTVEFSIVE